MSIPSPLCIQADVPTVTFGVPAGTDILTPRPTWDTTVSTGGSSGASWESAGTHNRRSRGV